MGKLIIKNRGKRIDVSCKLFKEETINEYELEFLKYNESGFFYPVEKVKFTKKLRVNINSVDNLNSILYKINFVNIFVDVLDRINQIIDYCRQMNLNTDNLELYRDCIFIEGNIKNIKMIYWPINNSRNTNNIYNLFKGIAMFLDESKSDVFYQYKKFFELSYFDYNKYKNMINEFKNHKEYINKHQLNEKLIKQSQSQINNLYANQYNEVQSIQNKVPSETGGRSLNFANDRNTYSRDTSIIAHGSKRLNFDQSTTVLNNESSQATTVLGYAGTTVLGSSELNKQSWPYLMRTKNNDKIDLNKARFRIGKGQQYVDYSITSNPAISRNHCDIITKNGQYYIIDHNSTNHTYINDCIINPGVEVEIFSGTKIMLADEEFVFYI